MNWITSIVNESRSGHHFEDVYVKFVTFAVKIMESITERGRERRKRRRNQCDTIRQTVKSHVSIGPASSSGSGSQMISLYWRLFQTNRALFSFVKRMIIMITTMAEAATVINRLGYEFKNKERKRAESEHHYSWLSR